MHLWPFSVMSVAGAIASNLTPAVLRALVEASVRQYAGEPGVRAARKAGLGLRVRGPGGRCGGAR